MAIANSTDSSFKLEYSLTHRGELIYGTQDQLRSIGIGQDISFPDNPRKTIKTVDPRGLPVKICLSTYKGQGIYSASIALPGRERSFSEDQWVPFSFGVKMRAAPRSDEYEGTEEALRAAGLVQATQLPGKAGANKISMTILPNGRSPVKGSSVSAPPGTVCITKKSKSLYLVSVVISEAEKVKRAEKYHVERLAWEHHVDSLPRPKPLFETKSQAGAARDSTSLPEFRDSCRLIVNAANSLILGGAKENGFEFSKDSMARLNFAFSEIRNVIEGGIRQRSCVQREGNVIRVDFSTGEA